MTLPSTRNAADSILATRLQREMRGDVLFSLFSRGRYASDASIYQGFPLGIVVPRSQEDLHAAVSIAWEEGVPVIARGGGTGLAGQAVGEGLIIDFSKYLNKMIFFDANTMTCAVEPGITPAALNRALAAHGAWFPVDIGAGAQATIGGMAGTNAAGPRAIRYGAMRDNVAAIDAVLANGAELCLGEIPRDFDAEEHSEDAAGLIVDLLLSGKRHEAHLRSALSAAPLRAGGYGLDALLPDVDGHNLAPLLVGSEGTLALSKRLELRLVPQIRHSALGICHFPTLRKALAAVKHIAALKPSAVELVSSAVLASAAARPELREAVRRFVRGTPDTVLLVEFAEDNQVENLRLVSQLAELVADLGHANSVTEAVGTEAQRSMWQVHRAGLAGLMAAGGMRRPVCFIEDCAVPLDHLDDYAARLSASCARHGVEPLWSGQAAAGCLHLRPALDLGQQGDRVAMRALAEEAVAMVRDYKGALSGAHGVGIARGEFLAHVHDPHMLRLFADIKARFDPQGRLNPGKMLAPPPMDEPAMLRAGPQRREDGFVAVLDWPAGSLAATAERCDGTAVCRAVDDDAVCPSFLVTGNERDSPRGRANSLRLALAGQLGPDALSAPEMLETMALCVGCKACRSACPNGIDIAAMKIEVLDAARRRHGLSRFDRLYGYLPHYGPRLRKWRHLLALRDLLPPLATLSERLTGIAAARPLPRWRGQPFRPPAPPGPPDGPELALLADSFNQSFEPHTLHAAAAVLAAAGYRLHVLAPPVGERPLCCGRSFLDVGLVDEARGEAQRLLDAARPFLDRGIPILGIEPACLLTLRDEFPALLPGPDARRLSTQALLFAELLARERDALSLPLKSIEAEALLHGHCHQKVLGALDDVKMTLGLIPGLRLTEIVTSCCGMAGCFGYRAETLDVSLAMGEQYLFPAIRAAGPDALLIADGFLCRRQIEDGTGRVALHSATVLKLALLEADGSDAGEAVNLGALRKQRRLSILRRDYFDDPKT